ncbi:uncharacterized protein L3040_005792 [Drepanopeziza brunnea f. sp. 'multigermtubi']|uniref:Carbonic anhydrase n=1 Tax=Marssonina brunnea f. sp. multigermtubi (strain MB_m1) TaxID=1072389 RepID=K1XKD9_MARBU|nr:carbonic anhydrase [Drepanopeziza brunnea f. sp. 'multigermtubi' MB_m1]EKD12934.1 carbonic anhydrase [Drepanopeziza brunnea f. sp. 'multigermtubi' MB_m1]KAJ5041244.1 hypothetical protein L3040_005792 [Drepanopeziza brunnea f. sp. 'multigermtubi']
MIRALFAIAALASNVLACPDHSPSKAALRKRLLAGDGTNADDWTWDNTGAWPAISAICGNGTMQSPIDLDPGNFSQVMVPTFNYAMDTVCGSLTNSGYGPAFTLTAMEQDDIDEHPSFTADGVSYYLLGWHTHTPSEHTFGGQAVEAELHLVHGDKDGNAIGVVGFPLTVGDESSFLAQFMGSTTMPSKETETPVAVSDINMGLILKDAGDFQTYWSYAGSLTTPPCSEGKRWWVSGQTVTISPAQWEDLQAVSAPSAREVQKIGRHRLNQD